ncbi:STAS domain-containing protein [Aliiglaciecola sp. CAU 1673]|uniref:STAS domain-containing protein n=1 Tax=Aliiglaciecola sp. CAU 1673 TaxID=3032595 RepID=UPI0023DACA71|nr:STAS domain-containing protein [Aliiglaciecola sp. CAU 1673]MDF2178244.1 STAS domain-containing protein [Aliiglaciecola sp. CAU 1673]
MTVSTEKQQWQSPASLTIYDIKQVDQQMHEPLQKGSWMFDLSALKDLDSTGVQWLMMAQRRLQKRGELLQLVNVQDEIKDIFAVLGVLETLSLKQETNEDD